MKIIFNKGRVIPIVLTFKETTSGPQGNKISDHRLQCRNGKQRVRLVCNVALLAVIKIFRPAAKLSEFLTNDGMKNRSSY